jgi:hypothetical protein
VDRAPPSLAGGPGFARRVVDCVGHFPGVEHAAEQPFPRFRPKRSTLLLELDQCGRGARAGGPVDALAVAEKQGAEPGLADAHRVLQHGLEHRLELAGRAADDLQHLGGRGLLLQRFAQLAQQLRIFDGDHSLGGEVLHQLNLFVGEGADLLAIEHDGANQLLVLKHRYA